MSKARPNNAQFKPLFQSALTQRFGLVFHHEDKRNFAVYALTVGLGGPKMKVTSGQPSDPKNFMFRKLGALNVTTSTMQDFCNGMQSAVMDKPVVDHTGLTDRYDYQLNWTPDESQFGPMGIHVPPPNPDDTTAAPGLFATAIPAGAAWTQDGSDQSNGAGHGDRQVRKARRELGAKFHPTVKTAAQPGCRFAVDLVRQHRLGCAVFRGQRGPAVRDTLNFIAQPMRIKTDPTSKKFKANEDRVMRRVHAVSRSIVGVVHRRCSRASRGRCSGTSRSRYTGARSRRQLAGHRFASRQRPSDRPEGIEKRRQAEEQLFTASTRPQSLSKSRQSPCRAPPLRLKSS